VVEVVVEKVVPLTEKLVVVEEAVIDVFHVFQFVVAHLIQ
jgi:hypothetical protein